jgi:hypothetical protein
MPMSAGHGHVASGMRCETASGEDERSGPSLEAFPRKDYRAAARGKFRNVAWLWFLVGAVVVIGVIVVVLVLRYMGARDSVVTGGWLAQGIDAYRKGSALHEAMTGAVHSGALATAGGDARWADIQRRADDLTEELNALQQAAVGPEDRSTATDALGSLHAARSAMEAYRDAGGDAGQADTVRDRLSAFEESLRALRSPRQHLW